MLLLLTEVVVLAEQPLFKDQAQLYLLSPAAAAAVAVELNLLLLKAAPAEAAVLLGLSEVITAAVVVAAVTDLKEGTVVDLVPVLLVPLVLAVAVDAVMQAHL